MADIIREALVKSSVFDAIKTGLPDYGVIWTPDAGANAVIRAAFPTPDERSSQLALTTLALAMSVDDGGRAIELGSTLTEYVHTVTAWVFAIEPEMGEHIANAIKHVLRRNLDVLPLYDYNQDNNPQIDTLIVDSSRSMHQLNNSSRPWDRFVWTNTIRIVDQFYET